jgi:hypothetical protein
VLRTVIMNFRQLALLLVAGFALAACQAADGTTQAPDTALVAGLMSGLGAVDPKAKPIEYKPRAPLAMPAEMDNLPEPETQVAGSQSEAWPKNASNKDLEEVKAIYADADGRHPGVLSPEQMRGINIRSNRTRDIAAEKRSEDLISGERMTSVEMNAQNSSANDLTQKANALTRDSLPKRRYLTDPPAAYSVPSADAPMPDIVKNEAKTPKHDEFDGKPLDMRCLEESGGDCRRGNN